MTTHVQEINNLEEVPFSVCMCVYHKDNPLHFKQAVESISCLQTVKPTEIIIVVDGPIYGVLEDIVSTYEKATNNIKIVRLSENGGLGNALKIGVEEANNDIIFRMDSDDVAVAERFEKQVRYLQKHPECDIVGGQISEFIGEEDNVVGSRIVPCTNKEIYEGIRIRCPFNHMTVAMRRSKVLSVGNYQDWHYNEDYYLWIRMAEAGFKFANLPDTLVKVRVGKDMYARRGGWKYFKSEKGLQDYMLRKEMISLPRYIFNVAVRFGVQVAMPNRVRGLVFQKLFRK